MEEYKLHRHILCIDLKSFYASVECALSNLDPFKTPLVVADASRGGGSIVLAVSPYLKTLGVPSRCRIHEIPKDIPIIFRKPRMTTYLEYSTKIIEIYLKFISEDDLYVYSIDEAFLDITEYLSYYKKTDVEIAKMILDTIYQETKLFATCGIGPNMLMSKLALDIESKKAPDFIAKWTYDDIPTKLWPVTPLSEMWGIGHNMERNLSRFGLETIGDIAHYDLTTLKKNFGILGEELYYHTHGIDMSMIQQKKNIRAISKSYGSGQTLFHDYFPPDIFQIILEMVDDVTRRLRLHKKVAKTVHFGIGYSKEVGGGFGRQISLEQPSANASIIYEACIEIFHKYYEDEPIRRVHVSVTNLSESHVYQFSLFENAEQIVKEHQLHLALDELKFKYGRNTINRASSEFESSTIKARNKMIGGHHA
ncbi:MAG: damage repair protein [Tenericutes bacterium HGW-Tenericutes-2]|jgi:DNA polymerase V|nr:MAG: damage repair protein [Tenericutes bacterium HGW-Tenericutes-2]